MSDYQRQTIEPNSKSWRGARQEVRNNPRWDKKMKYIRKLKKRGLL